MNNHGDMSRFKSRNGYTTSKNGNNYVTTMKLYKEFSSSEVLKTMEHKFAKAYVINFIEKIPTLKDKEFVKLEEKIIKSSVDEILLKLYIKKLNTFNK